MECAYLSQVKKDALNQLPLFFQIDSDKKEATYKVESVTLSWFKLRTNFAIKVTVDLEEEQEGEHAEPLSLRLVRYSPYGEVDTGVPTSGEVAFIADLPGRYGFVFL